MDDRARLRISLGQREFEVEGSEAFVREFPLASRPCSSA